MKKQWVLTQEGFDALLGWLDPSRDLAAERYESIRRRLITIFSCRGCLTAEDLADETINRVTSKLPEIQSTFDGDPARYFYGVANKVHLEYIRTPRPPVSPEAEFRTVESEKEFDCLDRCMDKLSSDNRALVLSYYQEEKHAKIEHRRAMAANLGIALNALRIRAHRIRASLQQCVQECLTAAS